MDASSNAARVCSFVSSCTWSGVEQLLVLLLVLLVYCVLQRMVLQHIGPDTILVGHALENDLKALKASCLGCSLQRRSHVSFGAAAFMSLP